VRGKCGLAASALAIDDGDHRHVSSRSATRREGKDFIVTVDAEGWRPAAVSLRGFITDIDRRWVNFPGCAIDPTDSAH
jgi:hypothetical protein